MRNIIKLNLVFVEEVTKENKSFIKERVLQNIINNFYFLGSYKTQEDSPTRKVDPFSIELVMEKAKLTLNLYNDQCEFKDIMEFIEKSLDNIEIYNKTKYKDKGLVFYGYNNKLIMDYSTFKIVNVY